MPTLARPHAPHLRDTPAVADLFVGVFRRDMLAFFPQSRILPIDHASAEPDDAGAAGFRLIEQVDEPPLVDLFGSRYRLEPREGGRFTPREVRMIRAVGAVLNLRYHHLFQIAPGSRLELYRGGAEDHYVAAFVEPDAYTLDASRRSRVASAIQTLRTAALSTYENRRVSTGALLLGTGLSQRSVSPADALPYGVELTSLKSIHKLCDGRRTLFLVDPAGGLAEIIDVEEWSRGGDATAGPDVPCARSYAAHARVTLVGGNVCVVLSPNQEIKVFADGSQAFTYAHGRWRLLDPVATFATWSQAVGRGPLARKLFQAALDLAESRQGGMFVVIDRPLDAVGRLIAPHDLIAEATGAPPDLAAGDPLAKRALHYLARHGDVNTMAPAVLEAFAGLDGALAVDRGGRVLAFGAILRHDATAPPGLDSAEGARTTAALVASRFGPVLKVSEDGVVSCFLRGSRVWDL